MGFDAGTASPEVGSAIPSAAAEAIFSTDRRDRLSFCFELIFVLLLN